MTRWSFGFAALAIACSSSPENPTDGGTSDGPIGGDASPTDGPIVNPDTGSDAPSPTDSGSTTGQWVLGYYVGYDINAYPIASDRLERAHARRVRRADGEKRSHARSLVQRSERHGPARRHRALDRRARTQREGAFDARRSGCGREHRDGVELRESRGVRDEARQRARDARLRRHRSRLGRQRQSRRSRLARSSAPRGAAEHRPQLSRRSDQQQLPNRRCALRHARAVARSLQRANVLPIDGLCGPRMELVVRRPLSGISGSTPIAIDDTLTRYATAGIPKAKLGMGTGFYAICYTGGITGPRQPTNGTSQTIVGGDNTYPLAAFFASGSTFDQSTTTEQKRDTTAAEPYLSLTNAVNDSHCGASTQYISYDDETSLDRQRHVLEAKRLRRHHHLDDQRRLAAGERIGRPRAERAHAGAQARFLVTLPTYARACTLPRSSKTTTDASKPAARKRPRNASAG